MNDPKALKVNNFNQKFKSHAEAVKAKSKTIETSNSSNSKIKVSENNNNEVKNLIKMIKVLFNYVKELTSIVLAISDESIYKAINNTQKSSMKEIKKMLQMNDNMSYKTNMDKTEANNEQTNIAQNSYIRNDS